MPQEQFGYDAVGNRTSSGGPTPGLSTTLYSYDFENRLTDLSFSDMTVQYKYDPFSRRIEKNVNGVITKYVYDGANIIAEYDGSGSLSAKYYHNLIMDDAMAMEQGEQGGSTYYYHKDGLGSITDITDASGNIVGSYTYKSFGEGYSLSGGLVQPYMYTGREYDPESGLYFYQARYYDPKEGRFLTKHPIGFAGGDVNLYRYVRNNPVNVIDPSGLSPDFGDCLIKCAGEQFGLTTLLGVSGLVLGLPLLEAGTKFGGSTQGTSIASKYLSQLLPYNLGRRIWAPTFNAPFAASPVLGRVLGRWVPIVGVGLLTYDAVSIGFCVNECLNNLDSCQE